MWNIGKKLSNELPATKCLIKQHIIFLPFFIILLVQCGRESSALPGNLQTAHDSFYSAIETGNDKARIALFADDAIMMPNHGPLIQGKSAIAAIVRSGDDWIFRIRNRSMVDGHISGNTAYTVNSYEYTYHRNGQAPHWHKTKNVHIWEQNPRGTWKLHVDIWNSDVPVDNFNNE